MLHPDTALRAILDAAAPLAPAAVPRAQSLGLVLAQDLRADGDYPAFPRSMMDGFAVRVSDAGRVVAVAGEVAAGQSPTMRIEAGSAVEIMTGAPCPAGAEAVVPKEEVTREAGRVTLPAVIEPGKHIAPAGSECAKDRVVAPRGTPVTPLVIANMAAFGYESVLAVPRPRCAVITTGSEVVMPGVAPGPHQIRNSNGPMLEAFFRMMGMTEVTVLHALDTEQDLLDTLDASAHADIVLLTGVVSVGKYDLVPGVLERFGVEPVFHKVAQRPGKPTWFGRKGPRLYFGLPGNPLACHLGFHRYAGAAIRKMTGRTPEQQPVPGRLMAPVKGLPKLTVFQLFRSAREQGEWQVTPLPGKGSADLYAPAAANAYVRVEADCAGLAAGDTVAFFPILE